MTRYLDPKNDLVFKRVFGQNPDLLKSFLNALLPLPEGRQIESLEYLSPEEVPDNPLHKLSIVDVRCYDNYGRQFIVEMQLAWTTDFLCKVLLNSSRVYSRQLRRGRHYKELQNVYGLGILNDVYDHDTDEFYHCYGMYNPQNLNEKIEGIEIVMVELPKFKPESWADKRMAVLWLRFLKEVEDSDIQKALTVCEEAAFTDGQLLAYEQCWDKISSITSRLEEIAENIAESFEEGKEAGLAEGLAEGKEAGLAEGLAEGLAKGEQERQALLQKLAEYEQKFGRDK